MKKKRKNWEDGDSANWSPYQPKGTDREYTSPITTQEKSATIHVHLFSLRINLAPRKKRDKEKRKT